MKTTIEKFINKLRLDNRIPNGIFLIENNDHMNILEEYLVNYGVDIEEARKTRNKVLEGRFPERQAYNKDGILVTFPTPEYKQRAIQRGTHFEQNPVKKQSNVFGQSPAQPQQTAPAQPQQTAPAQPQQTAPAQPKKQEPEAPREQPSQLQPAPATPPPATPVAPPSTQSITSATQPITTTPTAGAQPVVVPTEPTTGTQPQSTAAVIPPSAEKTPEQKQAEAEYVEKLLKTEISIDEAKQLGWKCNLKGEWLDSNRLVRGKTIYNETTNKLVISSV